MHKQVNSMDVDGVLYIKSTFNNVIFTFASFEGKPMHSFSCGQLKDVSKGERSKYLTILEAVEKFSDFLFYKGIRKIFIKLNGVGLLRKTLIKGFKKTKLQVFKLINLTAVPHNGCRPKKYRRV